jgi:hypothetical protein
MTLTSGIEAWTELSPATSPPDRAQHDVTYDTVREQMFIHGGLQYASDEFYALDDAWVFGGANWSQAGTNQPRPVRRRGAGAVYDMDDDRHILFAGEIFPNRPPPNPVMVLASDMKFVPRSLNLTSQGQWVGCHIPAPEGYEATDINIPSLRLNGVVSPDGPISFEDTDGDGTVDLVVKFPRADVIATLEQITASTEIIVTGDVGSDEFQATDVIRTLWVGNQAVAPGFTLDLEMSLDAAMPDEKLHYSIHGAPAGVTFDAHTGQFRWSPNQSDAGKTYLVTFAVHEAEFALSESIVIRVNGTVPATLTRLTAD